MKEENLEGTIEKLDISDLSKLSISIMGRKVALANAEKAIAQNESAELSYKYLVLQLYVKYGLTEADSITENGNIIRNKLEVK